MFNLELPLFVFFLSLIFDIFSCSSADAGEFRSTIRSNFRDSGDVVEARIVLDNTQIGHSTARTSKVINYLFSLKTRKGGHFVYYSGKDVPKLNTAKTINSSRDFGKLVFQGRTQEEIDYFIKKLQFASYDGLAPFLHNILTNKTIILHGNANHLLTKLTKDIIEGVGADLVLRSASEKIDIEEINHGWKKIIFRNIEKLEVQSQRRLLEVLNEKEIDTEDFHYILKFAARYSFPNENHVQRGYKIAKRKESQMAVKTEKDICLMLLAIYSAQTPYDDDTVSFILNVLFRAKQKNNDFIGHYTHCLKDKLCRDLLSIESIMEAKKTYGRFQWSRKSKELIGLLEVIDHELDRRKFSHKGGLSLSADSSGGGLSLLSEKGPGGLEVVEPSENTSLMKRKENPSFLKRLCIMTGLQKIFDKISN